VKTSKFAGGDGSDSEAMSQFFTVECCALWCSGSYPSIFDDHLKLWINHSGRDRIVANKNC